MDNRHALIADCSVTQAVGTGERDAAKTMAAHRPGAYQKTLGAYRTYDTKGMVAELRRIGVTPHVAHNTSRPGVMRHRCPHCPPPRLRQLYQRPRAIEKVFGWINEWGGLRQFKLRGTGKVSAVFGLQVIAYNLIRMGSLLKPALAPA